MIPEKFRSQYIRLSNDELIQLYKDGDLVTEAIPILTEEIKRRGCSIPGDLEVRQHTIEKEKRTVKKKAAIWSSVTLCLFLFIYQYGGYELIRDNLFPDNAAKTYIKKGLEFAQNGNHAKAIEFYQKARECNHRNSDVYLALGSAYMGLGRFKDSVTFLRKAIELIPDSGHAYGALAAAYGLSKDYEKAVLCAEKSLFLFEQVADNKNAIKAKLLLIQIRNDQENAIYK